MSFQAAHVVTSSLLKLCRLSSSLSSGRALQRGKHQVKRDCQLREVHPDGDAATCRLLIRFQGRNFKTSTMVEN